MAKNATPKSAKKPVKVKDMLPAAKEVTGKEMKRVQGGDYGHGDILVGERRRQRRRKS